MTFRRALLGTVKPPHATGVAWGNPIANGLRYQQVYTDSSGRDDAGGKAQLWTSPANVFMQAAKKWGTAAVTTGNTVRQQFGATRLLDGAFGQVTLRFLFQAANIGSQQALIRASSGTAWYIKTNGKLAYYTGATFNGESVATLANGEVYDFVVRSNNLVTGGTTPDIFINGRLDTATYPAGNDIDVGNFDVWGDAFNQNLKGPKFLFQAWQRFLMDGEIAALYREPFQLSYANNPRGRVAVRAAAGGGGGFQSAWAVAANTVIAPGAIAA